MIEINDEIVIEKDPAIVWGLLTNISNWGRWTRVVKHSAIYGPLKPGTSIKCIAGQWDFEGHIGAIDPDNNIVLEGKSVGIKISMSWIFSVVASGTNVSIEAKIDGWLSGLFTQRIKNAFEDSIRTWLNSLKATAERGNMQIEKPTIESNSVPLDNRTIQFTDSLSLLFRRKKSGN